MECDPEEEEEETPERPNPEGTIFSLVFGDSDTDEGSGSEIEASELGSNRLDQWVKVDEVEGLWHCSQFLSIQQQMLLTKAVEAEGWFALPQHNQAMRFGDLPGWALQLCGHIRHSIRSYRSAFTADLLQEMMDMTRPLPNQILEREPLFDQMIANSYRPGEGIKAHVDLMRFEDGIAIVSLESACVMSFALAGDGAESRIKTDTRKEHQDSQLEDGDFQPWSSLSESREKVSFVRERDRKSGLAKRVDVLLKPGDLIVSHGPARYLWTHEIDRSEDKQIWFGQSIEQHKRISVTLRRLRPQ